MLSVIIKTASDPRDLALTLAPLVRGVIEAMVCDVVVVSAGNDDIAEIVSHSGARHLVADVWREGLLAAVASTRAPSLLIMEAGLIVPERFWPLMDEKLRTHSSTIFATKIDEKPIKTQVYRYLRRISRDQALIMPRPFFSGTDPYAERLPRYTLLGIAPSRSIL